MRSELTYTLRAYAQPAQALGLDIDDDDINITAPAVILRPIAIYQ